MRLSTSVLCLALTGNFTARRKLFAFLILLICALCSSRHSYATSTRYYISAASTPSGTATYCQGASTGFSCTPTGSSCTTTGSTNTCNVTWQWYLDGSPVSGASGTFVANTTSALTPVTLSAATANGFAAGSHTLACRFTSSVTNCSATNPITSANLNITVNAPPATVSVAGGGTVCGSATLTASGGSPGTIYYQGTTSNGTSTTTASSSQVVSTANTYYFRSRTAAGCWGTQGSATVAINPLPNVSNFGTNASSPCQGNGSTVTVSSSSVGNGTYTITYNLSGANSVSGATASLTMSGGSGTFSIPSGSLGTPGATTITITNVRNSLSCNAAPGAGNTASFTVNALPTTAVVAGAGSFCEATVLSATGGTGGTLYFQGTTSNGTSTATPSDLELILSSGTFYFRAQSPAGCWGPQGSAAVVIDPLPADVSVSGGGTFCNATSLTATGGTGGTIFFQGTTSNGTSTAITASSQSVSASGTYYFRARTAAGCWGNQGSATVTINSDPNVTDLATSATSLCTGNGSTVTVTSSSLANGTYTLTYNLSGANSSGATTASLTMSGGTGSFSIPSASLGANGSTTVTITNIQNASSCSSAPASGNAATFSVSALPAITSISASLSQLCVGTGVTLTATGVSGPGAPTSFNWAGPNSFTASSTAANTSFTPSAAASGNYSVTVTYPGTGCTSPQAITAAAVTINAMPSVANIVPSETQLCVGTGFTLTANAATGTGTPSFAWSGPGGYSNVTATGNTSVSATATTFTGAYSLTVTYPGTGCVTSQVVSMPVTVNDLPTLAGVTSSTTTICTGSDLTLTAGATTGTGTPAYVWTGPNGYNTNTSVNNATLTISSTAATGSYSLMVVYPGAGCNSGIVSTSAVTVNDLPTIAGIIPSSTTMCEGANLTLTAGAVTGTGTPSYNWSGPNSFSAVTATNTTALATTAAASGVYSVYVTYSGTGCNSATAASATVAVNALPAIGSITASTTNLCVGTNVTLTANSVTGTGTPTFNWSGPATYTDATSVNNTTFNAAATTASGSYSVIVTYPGTGCTSAAAVSAAINVHTLPTVAGITPSATALCEGSLLTLNAGAVTGTGTLSSYNWSGPDSYTQTTTGNSGSLTVGSTAAGGSYSLTVTYPGTGCTSTFVAAAVTVDPLPVNTTGPSAVCVNSTADLDNTDAGGTWSSSDQDIATVDADGIVSGMEAGDINIVYTLPTGCNRAYPVTVDPLPAPIAGDLDVCDGLETTLTSTTTGGTWFCEDAFQPVAGGILVTGTGAGTAAVTYTLGTGCRTTAVLTVFPLPDAITGMAPVCEQDNITLSNTTTGTWSTGDDAIADVASSGILSGINEGTAIITYTSTLGCITTATATVNNTPVAITGTPNVCTGLVTDLDNTTLGGTWSSSVTTVGTIDPNTGELHGIADGTTEIAYTLSTGCHASAVLTVFPLPDAITGMAPVCEQETITLTNTTTGGTWSTSDDAIADVVASSGALSGVNEGNATITYTSAHGCITTTSATVNNTPVAIAGTPQVCTGLITDLDNTTLGGTWSSSVTSTGTIDANTGELHGLADGTTEVAYTLATGCKITQMVTVHPLPAAISGNDKVCEGLTTTLTNTSTGGTWHSSVAGTAAVGSLTGIVSGEVAGNVDITYTLPTGCIATMPFTVNALPAAITGTFSACEGATSAIDDPGTSGTWASSHETFATIDATGNVSALIAGNTTITYTLPTGCFATHTYTVNPLPTAYTGSVQICEGISGTLNNAHTGGTWLSNHATIADVTTTGAITGLATGTAEVVYTLATGCSRTEVVTVNAAVPAITGAGPVCAQLSIPLSNTQTGGTWTSLNTAIATAHPSDGTVTGVAAGTAEITYTLPTGCFTTTTVTVNALPAAITGTMQACAGLTTTLSNTTPDGTWSGGTPGISTIDAAGTVIYIASGTAPVTYKLTTTGCERHATVTVNALPTAQTVTGGGSYCTGGTGRHIGLGNSVSGITYTLKQGTTSLLAMMGTNTPLDFGAYTTAGTYTVHAANDATGCVNSMAGSAIISITAIVHPSVTITSSHTDTVCAGTNTTFTANPVNGGTTPVYEWMVNTTVVSTTSTYAYIPLHGDVVKVKLTSSEACPAVPSVNAARTMTVINNQTPTIAIVKTSSDTTCQFSEAKFNAIHTWGGTTPLLTWQRNGSPVGTGATLSFAPADGDNITCKLTSNFRCRLLTDVTSNNITMNVDSVYVPVVNIIAFPGVVVSPKHTVTLTATVANAGPTPIFVWSVNGLEQPAEHSPVLKRHFDNGDVIKCTVYGSGACGLTSFNSISMIVDPTVSVDNIPDPIQDIKLSPNPNNGHFTVTSKITGTDETVDIVIINTLGQTIFTGQAPVRNGQIERSIELNGTFAAGMYMLHIRSASGHMAVPFILNQ